MADSLNISISTSVQLNALRELESSLERQIAQARALGQTGTAAYSQLEAQLGQVRGKMSGFGLFDKMKADASGLMSSIPGLGNAIGLLANPMTAVAGAAVGLVSGFVKMMEAGVALNEKLKNVQIGLAGVMKQFDTSGTLSFQDAMKKSSAAVEMLRKKAAESPATFQELASAYQATAGAMMSSGMSMEQQVDTLVTMSQTLQGLGIRSEQIIQESRAILTGNITEDAAAARILGITRDMIQTAKQEGKLYEFLQDKLSGFKEAGKEAEGTLTVLWSNLGDSWDNLLTKMSKPLYDSGAMEWLVKKGKEVLDVLTSIASVLSVGEIQSTFKDIEISAQTSGQVTKEAAEAAKKALEDEKKAVDQLSASFDKLQAAQAEVEFAKMDLDEQVKIRSIQNDSSLNDKQKKARVEAVKVQAKAQMDKAKYEAEQQQADQTISSAEAKLNPLEAEMKAKQIQAGDKAVKDWKGGREQLALDWKNMALYREQLEQMKDAFMSVDDYRAEQARLGQMASELAKRQDDLDKMGLSEQQVRDKAKYQAGQTYATQIETEMNTIRTARAQKEASALRYATTQITTDLALQSAQSGISAADTSRASADQTARDRANTFAVAREASGAIGLGKAGAAEAVGKFQEALKNAEEGGTTKEEADALSEAAAALDEYMDNRRSIEDDIKAAIEAIKAAAKANR